MRSTAGFVVQLAGVSLRNSCAFREGDGHRIQHSRRLVRHSVSGPDAWGIERRCVGRCGGGQREIHAPRPPNRRNSQDAKEAPSSQKGRTATTSSLTGLTTRTYLGHPRRQRNEPIIPYGAGRIRERRTDQVFLKSAASWRE